VDNRLIDVLTNAVPIFAGADGQTFMNMLEQQLAVLIVPYEIFKKQNFMGNKIAKVCNVLDFSIVVKATVKEILGSDHFLFLTCPVKHMKITVQAQNLAFFI
jgi:hypothetical protein